MYSVPDKTGRFQRRPHYSQGELDAECEQVISSFLLSRHRRIVYPVATDDLIHLLEQVAVVDQYADLKDESGNELWGVTEFEPGTSPLVKISAKLSSAERFTNPFRTTLTHEFAHVKLHGPLFELKASSPGLFEGAEVVRQQCKREQVESPAEYDWAEWQAGYCSGALLMPIGALRLSVTEFLKAAGLSVTGVPTNSNHGQDLITVVSRKFEVSTLAAKVRLAKLGFLNADDRQKYLLT
ncbi:MAG: ImmA/IrrE family metallo-endopeptidase [Acidobacteriia bacterium]|nr:ImmA/IrrE family metallo-endopeptidase [Terriglobia bacterium]